MTASAERSSEGADSRVGAGLATASDHRPQLDALRAFAVAGVLITHFWQPDPFPWIFRQVDLGFLGVRLFFVLSGFLITRILLKCRDGAEAAGMSGLVAVRQFYARRFLRIFPLYYFIIVVAMAIDIPPARAIWPWLVTYSSNFYTALWEQNAVYFGHFWTLAVEEQFYLVWPWLVLFAPRRWLAVVVVAAVAIAPIYRDVFPGGGVLPFASLDTLGTGAMLALVMHREAWAIVVHTWLRRVILPLGLFGYLALHSLATSDGDRLLVAFHEITYAMVCCWLIASADRGFGGAVGRFLELRPLVYLGKISYGVYAYHLFMPWLLIPAFRSTGMVFPSHGAARFVIAGLATLAVAALSWHLLERPFNRLKRHVPYPGAQASVLLEQETRRPVPMSLGVSVR